MTVPSWALVVVAAMLILAVRLGGRAWLGRAVRAGSVNPKRGWYLLTGIQVATVLVLVSAMLLLGGAELETVGIAALVVLVAYGGASLLLADFGIQLLRDLAPKPPPGSRHSRFTGDRERRRSRLM